MDVSVHPFCGGGHPTDVRITTRYRSNNFIESLFAVIHETGHGLYEQGRMPGYLDLPVSDPLTMAIHESQSLFWVALHQLGQYSEDRPGVHKGYRPRQTLSRGLVDEGNAQGLQRLQLP